MTTMLDTSHGECRLLAYKLASLLAQKPTRQLLAEARDAAQQLATRCGGSQSTARLAELLSDAKPEDLEIEYTRLFVNAHPRLECPPYETVYVEHARRLMGRSGIALAHLMDEAGLKVAESFAEPPEHVAAELEFMAYLVYLELTGEARAAELQERLYREHLSHWIPEYAGCLRKAARHPLYKAYADLLDELIKAEARLRGEQR